MVRSKDRCLIDASGGRRPRPVTPALILHLPLFTPNSDKCWPAVNDSTVIGRTASSLACPAERRVQASAAARKPVDAQASIPLGRPIDAARWIIFERAHGLLDAALGWLAPLVLGARIRGTDVARGAREPSIARVKTGAKQRQSDHLRHGTPPGPITGPIFGAHARGEEDCPLIRLD